jgi:pseudouridine-5'-phosphate glycosidase
MLLQPRHRSSPIGFFESEKQKLGQSATIGVHRGVPTVGLTHAQIEELAGDDEALKIGYS